jgi:hypothetical protein
MIRKKGGEIIAVKDEKKSLRGKFFPTGGNKFHLRLPNGKIAPLY